MIIGVKLQGPGQGRMGIVDSIGVLGWGRAGLLGRDESGVETYNDEELGVKGSKDTCPLL